AAQEEAPTCAIPGCDRPARREQKTGRPAKCCELPDPERGFKHNRAALWRIRNGQKPGAQARKVDGGGAEDTSTPVSNASDTLREQLRELPGRLTELHGWLGGIRDQIAVVGDLDAAAYEVEETKLAADARLAEAKDRQAQAER